MGLLDDLPATKAVTASDIYDALEAKFILPAGLSEAEIDALHANWQKVSEAVAEHLDSTMQHIIDHGVEAGVLAERAIMKHAGFVTPDSVTVTYDSTARTVTVTQGGAQIEVMFNGLVHLCGTSMTTLPHSDVAGVYYLDLTWDDELSAPVLTWSTDFWDFSITQVAVVNYNGAGAANTWSQRECHGCRFPFEVHENLHHNIGTYKESGGLLTVGTYQAVPASPVDADNRPGVDETEIVDEDLTTVLPLLADGGPYTTLHFTGAGTPVFDPAAVDIYRKPSGSYIWYNPFNGTTFSDSEGQTLRFYNVYLIGVPTTWDVASQKHRFWWLQPQAQYSTYAAAVAEDFRTLSLGFLSSFSPEFVALLRVTFNTGASYGTVGKCRIQAVTVIEGSRASQVLVSGAAVPSHNSLTDRDAAGSHPASAISYDNAVSGLVATDIQAAIDEIASSGPGGGPQRVTLATLVIAPAGVTYSGGANAPPASAECTWRSLLFKTGSGIAYAQLWDITDDIEVDTATSTSLAPEVKDVLVTITDGHVYEVRAWTTGTGQMDTAIVGSSQLIVG